MREVPQPKARILELYGAFGRRAGGWIAISHLITLLGDFGIEETAIRSACSRMKAKGLLISEKRHDTAGYRLSDATTEILADGDGRIFRAKGRSGDDEEWVACVFSVPEAERSTRYLIRSRLTWLGYGQAAPGVWIAPSSLRDETERMMRRLGVVEHVMMWQGVYLGFADEKEMVAAAWDLPALRDLYETYLEEFEGVVDSWDGSSPDATRRAFIEYLESLAHWRRLPYLDPGLPPSLTPDDWPAERARALFNHIDENLASAAFRHFESVIGG
ncbi:MAG: PaaX family transcriptional regulator [Acidimicrobiia bacterium]|nr:PaaX family transcriptional regulator [Acidimicrobiia bacterium]